MISVSLKMINNDYMLQLGDNRDLAIACLQLTM
jgi:hypothetical protein